MPDTQPGLLQRLFGTSEMTPEMQQAIDIVRKENPNVAPVQPYGPIARIFGGAQGWTSPAGTIYLNSANMQGMQPQDIADTITHENVHAQQMAGSSAPMNILKQMYGDVTSGFVPYGQRPTEMAAFQAERNRRAMTPTADRSMVSVYPSFMNPKQEYVAQDIRLPAEKRR